MRITLSGRTRLLMSVLVALAWMVFIFCMSAKDSFDSDALSDGLIDHILMLLFGGVDPQLARSLSFPVRKLAHFAEYAILGVLLADVFRVFALVKKSCLKQSGRSVLGMSQVFGAWVSGTMYAATDEFHQAFVPGRSAQVTDVLIDSSGVLLGVVLFSVVLAILARKIG